eukprot:8385963-Pyramimonas_sp.AAC.1
MRAGTHGSVSGSASAALQGSCPERQKSFARAMHGSPGKLSGVSALCSPGFGRYQVGRYQVPRRALRHR